MIKKLIIIGIFLLLLGGVAGVSAQQSDIGTGQSVRSWTTKWVDDSGVLIVESQGIKAVPICEDNAVAYVYESDIAPDSMAVTNQWTTSNLYLTTPLTIQQTKTVPYFHSANMVIVTDNATVQKYCNPPEPMVLK